MISTTINNALNEQINKEFYSGYLYLSISAYLKQLGYEGIASWLRQQAKEEVEHGLKIFDYLIECNSFVTLKQIRTPDFVYNGLLSVFSLIYEHEKEITNAVMSVAKQAEDECDRTTLNFIDWFIEEQVQEEENVKNIVKKIELFGENNAVMFLIDKELGERTE
ncbi:MAG: ferritin [bacterium]|nr:ferritin [bacterium]